MVKDYFASDIHEAEYNFAMGTVLRMDEHLRKINYFFENRDYKRVFENLQIIFTEIYAFLKKEREENEAMELKIEKMINAAYVKQRDGGAIFIATEEIDHILRKWDRELRSLMLKYKLYMKMADTRLPASKI